jgi:hypothetical protein
MTDGINFDDYDIGIFLAQLAYQAPDQRQSFIDQSKYAGKLQLDTRFQTDNFSSIVRTDSRVNYHAYRGTVNKDDVLTDSYLALGRLKDTSRYQNNKALSEQAKYALGWGYDVQHVGHSLGGTLADQIARETGERSITYNQGTSPVFSYGDANEKHQQVRMDNDIVSAFSSGSTIVLDHTPTKAELMNEKLNANIFGERAGKFKGRFGTGGGFGMASSLLSSLSSHFSSNFTKP